jgi:cytochrome c oxidase subunit II
MSGGDLVFRIFAASSAVAIAVMVFLANYGARRPLPQAAVAERGYALRRYWFALVLVTALAVFALSIGHFPYSAQRGTGPEGALHVSVVAQQYGFTVHSPLPLGRPIVFDVTSRDVNHGFGIYGPGGFVVSQVQAMPGYVNHLPVEFRLPGRYTIRCLEFCGIAHAAMQGEFEVR